MNSRLVTSALLALILGIGAGYVLGGFHHPKEQRKEAHHAAPSMHGTIADMTGSLVGKTGDEFDRVFLSEMIVHHEGAVAMAELALVNAQNEELKELAREIISAQEAEIAQMRAWQEAWYGQ
jgi:uncharacterized protein (DUF305 family)